MLIFKEKNKKLTDLSEDKGSHILALPEGGVEEVGERVGGEGGEPLGAVQDVVKPLGAPPDLPDWGRHIETLISTLQYIIN